MDENTIPEIIGRTPCHRHSALRGMPCWWIWPLNHFRKTPAICNRRALAAGFNGEIDPRSMRKY